MVDRFQARAMQTRLHIPILYGIDTVHGDGNMLGATVFPHNIGLGATRDPALVRRGAHRRGGDPLKRTAMGVRAMHLRGPRRSLGPYLRELRRVADLVKRMETAIDGLQGPPGHLDDNDRVLASAKHFAGDGDTQYGTGSGDYPIDQGIAITSRPDSGATP